MLKKEKPQKVEELAEKINKYSVIGLIDIRKMPAKAFQIMRKNLKGTAEMKVTKSIIIRKSLEKTGNLEKLKNYVIGEQGILLSNENPFKLFKTLKDNRTPATAKVGDIPMNDVIVKKGPTSIAPGPAISTFQKAGVQTTVQEGKITIAKEVVITKAGEPVTTDAASLFALLKMEPMEIGLTLSVVLEDNIVYSKEVLDVDQDQYMADIQRAVQEMVNLSINTGYATSDSIELMISKAVAEARILCTEANILDKGFIDDVLSKAIREAKALEETTNK